jgi:hypothetical protein
MQVKKFKCSGTLKSGFSDAVNVNQIVLNTGNKTKETKTLCMFTYNVCRKLPSAQQLVVSNHFSFASVESLYRAVDISGKQL